MSGPPPLPPPLPPGSAPPPLPGGGGGPAGPDAVKARYVAAARKLVDQRHAGEEGEGCVSAIAYTLIVLMALTVVLLPVAVWLYRRWRTARSQDAMLREALAFAEAAVPVMAFPLMVNSILRRPGTEPAPGLFLICFEPPSGESIRFMGELAERVGGGDARGMAHADDAFCRQLMADEDFRVYRRRKLPPTLTNGVTVYAIDLLVSPLLLAGRHISDELPLAASAWPKCGDDGRVMQMPCWLVNGKRAAGPGRAGRVRAHARRDRRDVGDEGDDARGVAGRGARGSVTRRRPPGKAVTRRTRARGQTLRRHAPPGRDAPAAGREAEWTWVGDRRDRLPRDPPGYAGARRLLQLRPRVCLTRATGAAPPPPPRRPSARRPLCHARRL